MMIDGGAGNEIEPDASSIDFSALEKMQFDPELAEKSKLESELQNELNEGKTKQEILENFDRPIDALLKGRRAEEGEDALLGACRARFNLDFGITEDDNSFEKMKKKHYRRILLCATLDSDRDPGEALSHLGELIKSKDPADVTFMQKFGNRFSDPKLANEYVYRDFITRYSTADKFQKFSDGFLEYIKASNPPKIVEHTVVDETTGKLKKQNVLVDKVAEYAEDMEEFKKLMFGKQQEIWDVLKDMEAQEKAVEEATEPWDEEEIDSAPEVVNKKKEYFESLPLYSEVIIDGYKYIISSQGYKTMEELEEAHSIENAKRGMMGMFGQSFKKAPDGLYYMVTKKTYN